MMYLTYKDAEHGAQTILYLIFEKPENLKNGGYYDEMKLDIKNPFTEVPENYKRLWKRSEEILGISFPAE